MERLCDWDGPRAREVRLLFDDVRAAPAVLTFLRHTRVGRIVPQALRKRTEWEISREMDREGEGGGFFFFCLSFILSFLFSFVSALERRRPYFGWQQPVIEETGYLEKPHRRCHGPSDRM